MSSVVLTTDRYRKGPPAYRAWRGNRELWTFVLIMLIAAACADEGVTSSVAASRAATAGASANPSTQNASSSAPSAGATQGTCPDGYKCVDPVKAAPVGGLVIQDGEGNPIEWACNDGRMDLAKCDEANPKGTCTDLPDPICVHVKIAGMTLTGCGQRCTP